MKYLILLLLLTSSAAYANRWDKTIKSWSVIDLNLTAAIIEAESNGDPKALSPKLAKGLMQVTRIALKDVELHHRVLPKRCGRINRDTNMYNPKLNILAGSCYFKLLAEYNGPGWWIRVKAYNAGPGKVNDWMIGKSKLPQETVDYVKRVKKFYNRRIK